MLVLHRATNLPEHLSTGTPFNRGMKNQLFESVGTGTFLSTTGTDPDTIPPKSDKGSRQNLCLIPKLKLKDYRYCSSVVLKLFLGDLTSFLFTF